MGINGEKVGFKKGHSAPFKDINLRDRISCNSTDIIQIVPKQSREPMSETN
jgi:hypothetical protein